MDCACGRGSTDPPPASTAAACRDARGRRPHSPSAPPPGSGQTARRSCRCISLARAPGCARAPDRPAPHWSAGPRCDVAGPSRPRPDTVDTTVWSADSSGPSRPPPIPSSRSPLRPVPTRPRASALAYSSPSAPIRDLPVASLGDISISLERGHYHCVSTGAFPCVSLRFLASQTGP